MRTTIWTGVLAIALIVAVGIAGTTGNSSMVWADTPSQQAAEPPSKPRGLEATASHDSVTLTWDDPQDDSITGYVILRRIPAVDPQGHFNELVSNTGTDATTYTDNTVSAETRYTYRIKAINEHGVSERSRWVHIDTPAAPAPEEEQAAEPPDKPRGLEATATHDSVTLTWNDPGDDTITGYVILRRVRVNNTGGDFSVLVSDTGTAALTYTDNTVAASLTYTYRIKAINEHGVSERSRWFHVDTPAAPEPQEEQAAEPPSKPRGLEATASHDSVTLTWDDPQDESITGYVILRRIPGVDPQGQFSELVSDTGTAATTYTDDTVSAETRYTYRIKAINEHGVSERSRWSHIDTPSAPEAEEPEPAQEQNDPPRTRSHAPQHFVSIFGRSHDQGGSASSNSDSDRLDTPKSFRGAMFVGEPNDILLNWDEVDGAGGYSVYLFAPRTIGGVERDWWIELTDRNADDLGGVTITDTLQPIVRGLNRSDDTPSFDGDHYVLAVAAHRGDDESPWGWSHWRAMVIEAASCALSYDLFDEDLPTLTPVASCRN